MRDRIEKLVDDLSQIEKDLEELEQIESESEVRHILDMDEHEEYTERLRSCMADSIDNVVETITDFKDVLEATELMSKVDFEALDAILIKFMAELEGMK